jgi:predicted MarR family transcription regulator
MLRWHDPYFLASLGICLAGAVGLAACAVLYRFYGWRRSRRIIAMQRGRIAELERELDNLNRLMRVLTSAYPNGEGEDG